MDSRERVKAVINRGIPDVIPTDMWGSASRIHNDLYAELLYVLDIEDPGENIRPHRVTSFENYELSDSLGCDFRHLNPGKPDGFTFNKNEDGIALDEWGAGWDYSAPSPVLAGFPLANATEADLAKYTWPDMKDPGRVRGLADKAKDWFENTDKAITATAANPGLFLEMGQFLRGPEAFFMDFGLNEKFVHSLFDKLTELFIELNLNYLEPVAPYIEWVEFTGDLGAQNRTFFSKEMFRKFFKERYRELFSAIKKKYPNMKIFYHSCGGIYDLIPELIDVGVDILNPITGMDPGLIKREFGNDVIFHGAVDIQRALRGSIKDVRDEVRLRFGQMGFEGGYIMSPTNHMLQDIPVQNVICLYRFAKDFCKY